MGMEARASFAAHAADAWASSASLSPTAPSADPSSSDEDISMLLRYAWLSKYCSRARRVHLSITSTGAFTPLCFFSSKATMAAVTRSVSVSPAISSLAVAIVTLQGVRYPLVCGWDGITRSRPESKGFQ